MITTTMRRLVPDELITPLKILGSTTGSGGRPTTRRHVHLPGIEVPLDPALSTTLI